MLFLSLTFLFFQLPFFVHHGVSFVPIGYVNQGLSNMDGIHGGAPWGAATIANGDGSRQPDEVELDIAEYQVRYFCIARRTHA
jgi:NAD(P)H dehydrogenase (quinone)